MVSSLPKLPYPILGLMWSLTILLQTPVTNSKIHYF